MSRELAIAPSGKNKKGDRPFLLGRSLKGKATNLHNYHKRSKLSLWT
ncbi:MAG: hypothetical protein JGK28_20050 [Microcoleus sp. PH2017_07_MST_O_A]|nr:MULTISPECIES: hypothetical protein [unclassified Microcoleus]MCC3420143.1 hypothetical protein [Microcoleus sp. PH2017_07_MST_O_A]MCC3565759.1 hypothetical protein [Microcoleus sp. PH2017_31_RDM_U_A]MCC3572327.1 hypothetical protein [Microcoleus sp. PH2017_34_RAT_O_A]MCC3578089.1 hypothetical protein [Microcoleus sp. PH2017_32_RDM_D_A]MCC3609942.1 hypothetical protein [Microcoleus sp. PH2017_40_RAT_O_B]